MELATDYIKNLDESFQFVSNSQDVKPIKEHFGKIADDFDSFFVKTWEGEYLSVWGMEGTLPYLWMMVYKIL